MKNTLLVIFTILLLVNFYYCTNSEDSYIINPVNSLPDTLPAVTIPTYDHLPLITIGNGTVSSTTAEALQMAIDSLSKIKKGGIIHFSTDGKPVTIKLKQALNINFPESLLVIDGNNLITLDAQNGNRVIECTHYSNLVLANIRIINGNADSCGGALLHPWYGTLACYNVTFYNNRCSKRGPEFGGGAVFAGGLEKAVFFQCTFMDNSASNGGAILNRGTNLIVDSCDFTNNTAAGNGGGKDAGAKGQGGLGGAVYIDGMNYDFAEPFFLKNSNFTNNLSNCHGSAVFSYYYKNKPGTSGAFIEFCGFYDNCDSGNSTSSAAALYHEGSPLKLHASAFIGNTTLKHAGAVFLGPDSPSEIVNCTFFQNKTPGNGGAIFGGKQKIIIINCTFSENEASYGPAIFNDVPEAVSIFNTLLVNNIPIVNPYAYRNCTSTYKNGNNVIQWPQQKENGKADNNCIPDAQFMDPLLEQPSFNSGATKTMALNEKSPVIGICDSCPATDQRGVKRKKRCDAGAYEFNEN